MTDFSIHDTIERALRSAGLDTQSGPMKGVSETIQRALASAGLAAPVAAGAPAGTFFRAAQGDVIDVAARVVPDGSPADDAAAAAPEAAARAGAPGEFVWRSHTGAAGTLRYKLYVPTPRAATPPSLLVMLHGCTQNPDDFAAGTAMNALAERHGFIVAWPAQSSRANGQRCWNWFMSKDQGRDDGEPSLIAGIAREVAEAHGVDRRRIFVAGLSAGAAMAVILGATHPDLFSGVGVHSGLPYGAAHDMPSAFAAMQGNGEAAPTARRGVPTIVFHGDRDTTVNTRNATAVVTQATESLGMASPLQKQVHPRRSANGRDYTRTVFSDAAGKPRVEQWQLHEAAHAWSGGNAAGSYADPSGPDASAEMLRFFLAQV